MELDSAQANTARSQTSHKLTLLGVQQIFLIFENLHFQAISDPHDDISKNFEYFLRIQKWLKLSAQANTVWSFAGNNFVFAGLSFLKENVKQKRIQRCAIQNKAHIFN